MSDHIAANLSIEPDDFDYVPLSQQGGLGKLYQLFDDEFDEESNMQKMHIANSEGNLLAPNNQ